MKKETKEKGVDWLSNRRRFLWYLLYTVFLGSVLLLGSEYTNALKKMAASTYHSLPYMIFSIIFPWLFGTLLALPHLVKSYQQQGHWYYDWVKLLAIGLPALYIALFQVAYYSQLTTWMPKTIQVLFLTSNFSHTVCGLIFGYVLISSLEKRT